MPTQIELDHLKEVDVWTKLWVLDFEEQFRRRIDGDGPQSHCWHATGFLLASPVHAIYQCCNCRAVKRVPLMDAEGHGKLGVAILWHLAHERTQFLDGVNPHECEGRTNDQRGDGTAPGVS